MEQELWLHIAQGTVTDQECEAIGVKPQNSILGFVSP
jgi:hypothetical protein